MNCINKCDKLVLGTAQFGLDYGVMNQSGVISQKDVKKILKIAKTSGIQYLDTAIAYGDSERVLGLNGVSQFEVVSKFAPVPEGLGDVAGWMKAEFKRSLSHLNLNAINGVLLHRPSQLLGGYGNDIYSFMCALKEHGLVKKIGISIYDTKELTPILKEYKFDIVQAPVSILDRRLEKTGWLEQLKEKNIEIYARSIFLQGLLLAKGKEIPEKFLRWSNVWAQWESWKDKNPHIDPIAACMAYPLHLSGVDKVIVGIGGVDHLNLIIKNANQMDNFVVDDFKFEDERLLNPGMWQSL